MAMLAGAPAAWIGYDYQSHTSPNSVYKDTSWEGVKRGGRQFLLASSIAGPSERPWSLSNTKLEYPPEHKRIP